MVPFNRLQLVNLYFSGYRYLVVENKNGMYGLVKPMVAEKRVRGNRYVLPILDLEVLEMACGIEQFPIFLKDY